MEIYFLHPVCSGKSFGFGGTSGISFKKKVHTKCQRVSEHRQPKLITIVSIIFLLVKDEM